MKRIGILTFHRSVNNGAVMQAYALSKRLMQTYPDAKVEIIDYNMERVAKNYSYTLWSQIKSDSLLLSLKKLGTLVLHPGNTKRYKKRTQVFYEALDRLPLSEFSLVEDGTDKLFAHINANYDILVVGSDAVWNYVTRGFPSAYFPDSRVRCRKLSYAASCYGMEYCSFAENNRQAIGNVLGGFDFLGVRDTATENFVTWSGCTKAPVHTCDPTAFLDINDLPVDEQAIRQKLKTRGFDFEKPAIGIMGSEKMCAMVRRMYANRYQLVSLYNYNAAADVNLEDFTAYEWAYVFRYFKLVFTTYFHGTMLSLRSGVPLICIALETEFAKKHTPKTLDVLTRLGYADWYFETDYESKNTEAIRAKADALLESDCKAEIIKKIDREAESFLAFRQALDEIVYQQGEKYNG